MPKSANIPRISIVTPSLNQGRFIEATIQSILSQNHPALEYIIMDGGSTDGTLDILKKYSGKLHWTSEKDSGQTDAINKGFDLATGDILGYLNADDILLPGALDALTDAFARDPGVLWLTGRSRIIDDTGRQIRYPISLYKNLLLRAASYRLLLITNYISQPSTFWHRRLASRCGKFDIRLKYVMDYEYWFRLWKESPPKILHRDLAGFRVHKAAKTTAEGHNQRYIEEERSIIAAHTDSAVWQHLHNLHRSIMTGAYSLMNK